MLLLLNVGSRYIVDEFSDDPIQYSQNIFLRRLCIFAVCFVGTKDLITSIILKELEKKKFEFLYFYERRIRRIIPAFIFLILFILPASFFILMPTQFLELSYSILCSIFFNSNIYFLYICLPYLLDG